MNPKRQIIVISVFFGIISLILIFVLIFPLFKKIKQDSLELISARKELSLFQYKSAGIEELRITYDKIEPDLKKIEEIFVDFEMPVGLIEFWEEAASDLGLSIKISPVSQGFRLSLTGSFNDFLKFLEKTERAPYLTKTNDLSVRSLAPELELEGVQANLIIELYVQEN